MAAACVNGPIIPPSIPLVIYGLSAGKGVSIIALFLGGLIPGVLLSIALMIMAYIISVRRNYPTTERVPLREIPRLALPAMWALMTPVIILVGVVGGVVTDHRERHHRRALRALRRLLRLSRAEAPAICGRSWCRPRSTRRS